MILRWLVTNLLREVAEDKVQQMMADARGQVRQSLGDAEGRVGAPAARRALGGEEASEPPPEPPPTCDVAVVFALGIESGGLVDRLEDAAARRYPGYKVHWGRLDGRQLLIAETGVGRDAARRVVAEVIARHQPRWVVSAGFAGGLVSELPKGYRLMADRVCDANGQHWNVGLRIAADQLPRGVHVGPLLTVDRLVRTREERARLAQEHGAVACDMESSAVADVCRQAKVRFLAVRIVSDGLDDELPPEIEKLMGQGHWASKLGMATAAIWNRPSTVKDLWRLKQEALQASDRLARFLSGVIAQLD